MVLRDLGHQPVEEVGAEALPAPLQRLLSGARGRRCDDGWSAYALGALVLVAGPPAVELRLVEAWGDGRVPEPVAEVSRVHDGVGPPGVPRAPFGTPRLLPVARMAPLTQWMRFGEEGILYAPADWLRFSVDPVGGFCVSTRGEVRHWSQHDHCLGPLVPWRGVWGALVAGWKRAASVSLPS